MTSTHIARRPTRTKPFWQNPRPFAKGLISDKVVNVPNDFLGMHFGRYPWATTAGSSTYIYQNTPFCTFVGSINNDVLTVTSVTSGTLKTGMVLMTGGAQIYPAQTNIVQQLTNTDVAPGGKGTYRVSVSQNVGSATMRAGCKTFSPEEKGMSFNKGSIRTHDCGLKWSDIEYVQGQYDWSRMDAYVNEFKLGRGVSILYTLFGTPDFYAAKGSIINGYISNGTSGTAGTILTVTNVKNANGVVAVNQFLDAVVYSSNNTYTDQLMANVTASISGNVMTVSNSTGTIRVGQYVIANTTASLAKCKILSKLSATTYSVSTCPNISSTNFRLVPMITADLGGGNWQTSLGENVALGTSASPVEMRTGEAAVMSDYSRMASGAVPMLTGLTNFITALLNRYNKVSAFNPTGARLIEKIETYNEPSFNLAYTGFWYGTAQDLVMVAKTVYDTVKGIDSGVEVLSPPFISVAFDTINPKSFMEASYNGTFGYQTFDSFGFHPYGAMPFGAGSIWTGDFGVLKCRAFLDSYGRTDAKMYVTEYGVGGSNGDAKLAAFLAQTPAYRYRFMMQLLILAASLGLSGYYLYMFDHQDFLAGNFFTDTDGVIKACNDFQTLIAGKTITKREFTSYGTLEVVVNGVAYSF